jgi:hypothetical protein
MGRNVRRGKKRGESDKEPVRFSGAGQKKIPFRKWKSATRTALRAIHRKRTRAQIVLEVVDPTTDERTVIMASILARGTVHKRYNKCGKTKCHCYRGPKRHGPYWYLALPMPMEMVRKGAPKTRNFYINEEEALMLRSRIANYKRIQQKVWDELYDELVNGGKLDAHVLEVVQSMG